MFFSQNLMKHRRKEIFLYCGNWSNILLINIISPVFLQASDKMFLDNRIMEWIGSERTLRIIQFQVPCNGQEHLPPDQLLKSPHPTWP